MWKLRQFFEGDTRISLEDVGFGCWAEVDGLIVPNSVAVSVNGTEYLISVGQLGVGVLTLQLPSAIVIGPTTTIRVYSKCEDEETSETVTSKPVDFIVNTTAIQSCNPQSILQSGFDNYIRFFFSQPSGAYFTSDLNGTNLNIGNFDYQVGETGDITGVNGAFGRPTTSVGFNTLISKLNYNLGTLRVTPKTTAYFTARYGYTELVFNTGNVEYINYMQSGDSGVITTYAIDDVFLIQDTGSSYVVRKNGVVIKTITKTISFTVTGGSVVPATSTVNTPVVWNLPLGVGSYMLTAIVGNSIKFNKSIQVHSCAKAVDDEFQGVLNTAYNFNVTGNDVFCEGENTYFEKVGFPGQVEEGQGTIVFNQNGTGTYTPPLNYTGTATFYYNIKCGTTFNSSEAISTAKVVIDYYDPCAGVVANWVNTGNVRCNNCVEEKEERDTNAQCTGNINRWVTNAGGNSCNDEPILLPTSTPPRCNNCVNEREVQDVNPCSPTFQQITWQVNPNGNTCSSLPNWQDNGAQECQSCVEKKQQKDNNTCSPTFNTLRWVDNPGGTQCSRTPVWTELNEFICINCVEYKKQQDTNSCSPSYQLIRDVLNPEGDVCTSDINWSDTGITRCETGVHQKQQVATNQCNTETSRWVNTGLDICGCEITLSLRNNCSDDNPIVGAVVTRTDIVENNRLISLSNNVITFKLDVGTFNYKVVVTLQNGMKSTINYPLKSCQPII